ncbi:MAG TPA: Lrp/AsnC ligand binding domain-containing protein [Rhizomicrobium sp.]|jgi:hypothetical protein|nr:Lrp/AsnC ligand binding domain-containing protein [Rhizomicrobium sp.]
MRWQGKVKNLWKDSTQAKAFILGIIANVISTPILPALEKHFPDFWRMLHLPDAYFVLGAEFLVVAVLGFVVLNRDTPPSSGSRLNPLVAGTSGGAYLMLKVKPGSSQEIAKRLRDDVSQVNYAAAVWGQWDVVARVSAGTAASFVEVLNKVQTWNNVERTETQLVRSDQPPIDKLSSHNSDDHFAFLLLKVPASETPAVLGKIHVLAEKPRPGYARVEHAVGILGTYDVALTVRYSKDGELANVVMAFCQSELGAETVTVPAIRDMSFIGGSTS